MNVLQKGFDSQWAALKAQETITPEKKKVLGVIKNLVTAQRRSWNTGWMRDSGVSYLISCTRRCDSRWCAPGRSHLCFGRPAAASQLSPGLCSRSTTCSEDGHTKRKIREGEEEFNAKRRHQSNRAITEQQQSNNRNRTDNRWWRE